MVHIQTTSVAAHCLNGGTSLKQRVDGSELILKQHNVSFATNILFIQFLPVHNIIVLLLHYCNITHTCLFV